MATEKTWTKAWVDGLPKTEGAYAWRIPHATLKGLTIEFMGWMRNRMIWTDDVLSPSFDYWDGYRLHVPKGIEWRELDEDEKASAPKRNTYSDPIPVGLVVEPCPFCSAVPTFDAVETGGCRGVSIGASPHGYDTWWLKCCEWVKGPRMRDPRELVAKRSALLREGRRAIREG